VRIGDDDGDQDATRKEADEGDGELDFDDAAAEWPAKPADYDSDYDFTNFDPPSDVDTETVEKFSAGEYVCLMVPNDKLAYARFKIQNHVDLTVTALIKSPGGLVQFGPGVYALVEFVGAMPGVITI
jgi:hypothetical protein